VPTIYYNLIQHYEDSNYSQTEKKHIRQSLQRNIRLMMCGSAALPAPIMNKWHSITGHWLLERYGMTEIGMALSNPLHGTRVPGAVGLPLPGVSVQIVDSESGASLAEGDANGTTVHSDAASKGGDLLVRGPSVFLEYWNRPTATAESFTDDGWFKTGDTAAFYDNTYHIMGRTSTDIIKSGGYKISALDVERHLLAHPDISDVAVLAVDDIKWGEIVAAVVVTKQEVDVGELHQWSKLHIPSYSIPRLWKFVGELPRNAMGKVNKKLLATMFYTESEQDKRLLVNSYFQELIFPSK
jgi:malonyl-CoA/methylmalonyl-CoA synthetase